MSLASPVFVYYWLDPTLQAFARRAKLEVSATPFNIQTPEGSPYTTLNLDRDYEIDIVNVGQLPAKAMSITIRYDNPEVAASDLQFTPPSPTDVTIKDRTKFVTLKRTIAPQDKLQVKFSAIPTTIWVSSEFGETTTIQTGMVILQSAEKIWVIKNGQKSFVQVGRPQ